MDTDLYLGGNSVKGAAVISIEAGDLVGVEALAAHCGPVTIGRRR